MGPCEAIEADVFLTFATPPLDEVAAAFDEYARKVYAGRSRLYENLSSRVALDPELQALASHARRGTPLPNLFFGAVHFLLLKGTQDPLSSFYPSIVAQPSTGDAFPYFRDFCLEHVDDIRGLISTRLVQTNEVGRCACLVPAYGLVTGESGETPLSIVEVGASAGLNLLWDHYNYKYSDGQHCGNSASAVQVECTLKGGNHPPLPEKFPVIGYKVGLDLNPIRIDDPEQVLWLRALIWPEHRKRAELLQNAIQLARQQRPQVVRGGMEELLPSILDNVPKGETLCIVHSFVLTFLQQRARDHLAAIMSEVGRKRRVFVISMEWYKEWELARLWLTSYRDGSAESRVLAHCGSHGEWLEWLGTSGLWERSPAFAGRRIYAQKR